MGVKELLFPSKKPPQPPGLLKAFDTFTAALQSEVEWLPGEPDKHVINQRLYLQNMNHAYSAVLTDYTGTEKLAADKNLLNLAKNVFLLMYSRGLIPE